MSLLVWLLLLLLPKPGLFEQGLDIDPELSLSLLAHLQVLLKPTIFLLDRLMDSTHAGQDQVRL